MKHLDVILILLGAAVCLFLLLPFRSRRIGPYWLTYVIPSVLSVLIVAAVITNAVRAFPPSQDQMWRRMEKLGYTPTDTTQQEIAKNAYNKDRTHKVFSADGAFSVTWYQFSFEGDGRQHISKHLEALQASDSRYQAEYHHSKYTTRCAITNGDDYHLLIAYNDTLLSFHGTIQQKDAIQAAADDLGYWE